MSVNVATIASNSFKNIMDKLDTDIDLIYNVIRYILHLMHAHSH